MGFGGLLACGGAVFVTRPGTLPVMLPLMATSGYGPGFYLVLVDWLFTAGAVKFAIDLLEFISSYGLNLADWVETGLYSSLIGSCLTGTGSYFCCD